MFGGGYVLSPINDANGSDIRVIDAYGVALFNEALNFKVGLSKIPFTRANIDDCYTNLTADRSTFVYSPFGTYRTHFSRNLGVVVNGSVGVENFKYWAAIIEGREGKSKWTNPYNDRSFYTSPEPSSNFGYVGRVHYSFLDPEGGGYQGSYLGKKKIFTLGAGISYEADVAYKYTINDPANTSNGIVDSTKPNDTVNYFAYTLDAFFEHPFDFGTITATALYLNADMDDAYKTVKATADLSTIVGGTNGQKDGYYLKLGYLLPITVGEKGKLQPYLFHENWDLAYLFGTYDQNVKQYGGGVNYYITGDNRVRLTAEYYDTQFDKPTRIGDYQTFMSNTTFDSYNSYRLMFQFVF